MIRYINEIGDIISESNEVKKHVLKISFVFLLFYIPVQCQLINHSYTDNSYFQKYTKYGEHINDFNGMSKYIQKSTLDKIFKKYTYVSPFVNNFSCVRTKDNLNGIIDTSGKLVYGLTKCPIYEGGSDFTLYEYYYIGTNSECDLILDINLKKIIPDTLKYIKREHIYQFDSIKKEYHRPLQCLYIVSNRNKKNGILDYYGNLLVKCKYDKIFFHDRMKNEPFIMVENNKYGVIKLYDSVIIPAKYKFIIREGNYFVTTEDSPFNEKYFTLNGELISYNIDKRIKSFDCGYGVIIKNGRFIVVDPYGKETKHTSKKPIWLVGEGGRIIPEPKKRIQWKLGG